MTDEIRTAVIAIVADVAEMQAEAISPDATLQELGIDSLGGLRIVAEVEKRWGIVISEQEITKIRSMADIFALVDTNPAVE